MYNKQVDISSEVEEHVGTMLPVVGLSAENDDVIDKEIIESLLSILDSDDLVEEGVNDITNNIKERVSVSKDTCKLIVEIYMLKKKIKKADKTGDNKIVIDLKRELVRKQMEMNSVKKSASPELQKEITKIEKNLEKQTKKFDIEDIRTESVKDEVFDESVDNISLEDEVIIEKEEDKVSLPPELKRLDEIRGKIEDLSDDLEIAKKKLNETGENIYENKVKGLTAKLDKLKKELSEKEKEAEKIQEKNKKNEEVKESVDGVITEAANMEDEIKPIVDKLNEKGYKVKYASPGHKNLRKKEDKEPDGVYYQKLYSDARVMFADKYSFGDAPKYWHWRDVDECSYLDITPLKYDKKDGSPYEAFAKWKVNYMNSLKTFVDGLETNGEDVTESVDEFADAFLENMFESIGMNDLENSDGLIVNESVTVTNSTENLLKELDELLN